MSEDSEGRFSRWFLNLFGDEDPGSSVLVSSPVTPVPVGKDNDGLSRILSGSAGSPNDRGWGEVAADGQEALRAWRNPGPPA